MGFEAHTAVKMSMLVFCVVTPCRVGCRWRQHVLLKRWYLRTSQHGVTTLKTDIDTFNKCFYYYLLPF
jgi:hypothetical protein